MRSYAILLTTLEVFVVIKARHADKLSVFEVYTRSDDGSRSVAETVWSVEVGGVDYPLIGMRTIHDIDRSTGNEPRLFNERHEYWLCLPRSPG